jgi:hypothetical protein
MKPFAILAALAALAAPAHARDREFDEIVRRIEVRCETKRVHIPLMGVANFFVKVARPAGTSDFKLAVFEDLHRPFLAEEEDFNNMVGEALGPNWRPLLRLQDSRNEWTSIYSSGSGKHWKLLIATMDRNEATILRVRLSPEAMRRWVVAPLETERNRHRRD